MLRMMGTTSPYNTYNTTQHDQVQWHTSVMTEQTSNFVWSIYPSSQQRLQQDTEFIPTLYAIEVTRVPLPNRLKFPRQNGLSPLAKKAKYGIRSLSCKGEAVVIIISEGMISSIQIVTYQDQNGLKKRNINHDSIIHARRA